MKYGKSKIDGLLLFNLKSFGQNLTATAGLKLVLIYATGF
jgi:hypothetical protein